MDETPLERARRIRDEYRAEIDALKAEIAELVEEHYGNELDRLGGLLLVAEADLFDEQAAAMGVGGAQEEDR